MPPGITLEGEHVHLASQDEIASGLNAAGAVFSRHNVDPLACAAACEKLEKDQQLTKDEALLCVIWDTADDKAFRAVTLNWLVRDLDIRLAVSRDPQ
jgi:hypothetical protein